MALRVGQLVDSLPQAGAAVNPLSVRRPSQLTPIVVISRYQGDPTTKWQSIIELAREMAVTPPSDYLHQARLRIAVGNAYYAMYHALARSNADLLIGPFETESGTPEWSRVYTALGGDSAFELLEADFSRYPEVVRRFVDGFLAAHERRRLAEEDPAAITEFLSVEPEQRRAFALQLLLNRPSEEMTGTGQAPVGW